MNAYVVSILVRTSLFWILFVSLNATERLVKLAKPKDLSDEAMISNWTRFNGPRDDAKSRVSLDQGLA